MSRFNVTEVVALAHLFRVNVVGLVLRHGHDAADEAGDDQ